MTDYRMAQQLVDKGTVELAAYMKTMTHAERRKLRDFVHSLIDQPGYGDVGLLAGLGLGVAEVHIHKTGGYDND